ncbi:hypothetical protein ACO0K0_19005 [Undibacterium sp. SXout11W]|uniref:hypothetical protein n=1 Tax=Undibacterium sp. SXout11W TaxID=3413050 RepID=UPI003BF04130
MQTKLYQCFGLTIRSDMALPCLPASVGALEDVYFHVVGVSEMPDMPAEMQILGANECQWRENTGNWHVHYTDALNGAELHFQIDLNEKRVEVSWTDGVSTVDIPRVILGAICGRLLQWTGKLAMHGNAVQIGHGAVLFCTDSGGGKSTASAALVEAGFPLVCDDIATLKIEAETAYLQPGYPHLRLWPDSAVGLGEHWQDLPTVFRRTQTMGNKCYRDLQHCPELFCAEALPLNAIYLLQTRIPGQNSTEINPISGRQAFPALFANIFQKELLAPETAACLFSVLTAVASRTPVFLVRAPDGLQYLPDFAEAIVTHSKNLASSKIAD